MKPAVYVALALIYFWAPPIRAGEADSPDQKCREVGKAFVLAKFGGQKQVLEKSLADEILLVPGHEYLKKEYGLNPSGDRSKGITVPKKKLIELDMATVGAFPDAKKRQIAAMLEKSVYTFVVASGRSDPIDEKGWQRKLPARRGDVVMRVQPKPTGDFLLYVLRKVNGEWRVVMDYTD